MGDYDFLSAFDEDVEIERKPKHGRSEDVEDAGEKKSFAQRIHLAELLIALIVAGLLAIIPFVAHAATTDETTSSQASAEADVSRDKSSSSSTGSNSSSSKAGPSEPSGKSGASSDGFAVTEGKTKSIRGKTIETKADKARGLVVSGGSTLIAGEMKVATKGTASPALFIDKDSQLSLVNSELSTVEAESPLISNSGALEIENVKGKADSSPIAQLVNSTSTIISNSTLESGYLGASKETGIFNGLADAVTSGNTNAVSGAIVMANIDESKNAVQTDAAGTKDASDSASTRELETVQQPQTARLQVTGSTLESSIEKGAMFYLTNTKAKVVLLNTLVQFDSAAANLITVAGNNVDGWGTSGKNGAIATVTCYDSKLSGNISVDAISSLDFSLLAGTSWNGTCDIDTSTTGETVPDNITVNIDATSSWTLTGNSTVTKLNLEPGAKLVDENGDAVAIIDADGNTLVDGASEIKVKVMDGFSTAIATSSANELEFASIERSAYDEKFATSTNFGENGNATSPAREERAREIAIIVKTWFDNL